MGDFNIHRTGFKIICVIIHLTTFAPRRLIFVALFCVYPKLKSPCTWYV